MTSRVRPYGRNMSKLSATAVLPAGTTGCLPVITRAAQACFLRSSGQKNRRTARLLGQRRPGPRDFEQHPAAGGVIHRAVINRVAVHRIADTQVIPVRAEDHGFLFQLGVAAFDSCRPRCASRSGGSWRARARESQRQSHGVEAAGVRDFQQTRRRSCPTLAAIFSPASLSHPSGERQRRLARRELHLLIFAAPGRSHHVPSVAGRWRGVNDDRGDGARGAWPLRTYRSSGRSK